MNPLVFTVTNDLTYDQRMIRICTTLAEAGFPVTLVGRKLRGSDPIVTQPFRQVRLFCLFTKGPWFYAEYNLRLLCWLLFNKASLICAIDLDTILPCLLVSRIRKIRRVYDAHELFCEMQEIVERPRIYRIWKRIEKYAVPAFDHGYTVNEPIAREFARMYGRDYGVIRNMPVLRELVIPFKEERYILFQGAVNEGRSFDTLIPAMQHVNARLFIAGDGNYNAKARQIVEDLNMQGKVIFVGKLAPADLRELTRAAYIGVTLFEKTGLSNYYSLANRYFDYLHAGIPQICVNYPVYRDLNSQNPVAVLVSDLSPEIIAASLNLLLENDVLYRELQQNCLLRREELNWQQEEKELVSIYKSILVS